jgi:predicted MFS family arabinose efflux permease
MPRSQAGVAAAVASTSRQVGAALGVAIIGSVINTGDLAELTRILALLVPS